MGIKFRCPNGHKLNVKSFLAGKRGVCPDCGQTFRIPPEDLDDKDYVAMPLESRRNGAPADVTVDRLEENEFEAAVAVAAAAVSEPVKARQESAVASPLPIPAARQAEAPFYIGPETVPAKAPAPQTAPAIPPPPPKPPVPQLPADPIAEAPTAVWYVRPPSGGQYGPAKGDVLRKWIAEGRVSADSLVWREDWTDWRDAGKLFPSLASANPAAAGGAGAKTPAAGAVFPTPSSLPATPVTAPRAADRKAAPKKKGNSDMAVAALVCLVLVCLILVTVLVIVLSRGSA